MLARLASTMRTDDMTGLLGGDLGLGARLALKGLKK
jgi:hypothetical protein